MIQTGYLSRNRVANGRVQSSSASCNGRTHRSTNLTQFDFVIDNQAERGQAIEIKTPAISSAERWLLAMVEAFAADSPLSVGDEQLLSLP